MIVIYLNVKHYFISVIRQRISLLTYRSVPFIIEKRIKMVHCKGEDYKIMIAEILSTGEELRLGSIIDTNSAYIAQRLEETGVDVGRHTCVGDDVDALVAIFREIGERSDIVVVTGGLGPTPDDLTTEAIAKAAGEKLVLDEDALSTIEAFFKRIKRPMAPSNRKQAMFPESAECILNPIGTAPGFCLKISRCTFFCIPGVPVEMRRMMTDAVLPRIKQLQGKHRTVTLKKTLSVFGITEAEIGERMNELPDGFPELTVGLRAEFPVIQITLYARGKDEDHLLRQLEAAADWALNTLGGNVFSKNGGTMEAEVGDMLRQQNATLAVAESCTGGLIADWITNVAGSSDYFLFSGVTYSNEAKMKVLGVSPETLARCGAVHEKTAEEMAEGARRISGATYGLSTSGIAGPDGGTPEKPVGTVCIGLATPEGSEAKQYHFHHPERLRNKTIFAITALNMLRRKLLDP